VLGGRGMIEHLSTAINISQASGGYDIGAAAWRERDAGMVDGGTGGTPSVRSPPEQLHGACEASRVVVRPLGVARFLIVAVCSDALRVWTVSFTDNGTTRRWSTDGRTLASGQRQSVELAIDTIDDDALLVWFDSAQRTLRYLFVDAGAFGEASPWVGAAVAWTDSTMRRSVAA